ncbi:PREDICTED: lipase member H-A-like [Nicrophorus vespilloides]|uniref:Lipase member H-A-like n=1 Tax=Nicrophorus vespilloides TaxID=110193 RepID=A0ABM1MAZ6_NICVS|nr:PREDICTED: lipase member H-A-like [Nicrophorus vespilloides]
MQLVVNLIVAIAAHRASGSLLRGFQDLQDYNFDDEKAPVHNLQDDVKFILYTREGPKEGELIINSYEVLKKSHFAPTRSTKFVIHGFQSSGYSDTCQEIKDKYLELYDYNIFVVDWSKISGNLIYFIPATSTRQVGEYFASLIDLLITHGADANDIHLIGHSLGAHISGFAGEYSSVNVSRITGLDPAFPSFGMIQLSNGRLSYHQAKFVDVIHTAAGTFGLMDAIGHADFYPNGGVMSQPGCNGITDFTAACSHGKSWQYFKESIDTNVKFASYKCNSLDDFSRGCQMVNPVYMGDHLDRKARGIFYLKTMPEVPYVINN